jgi:hypothetical protein
MRPDTRQRQSEKRFRAREEQIRAKRKRNSNSLLLVSNHDSSDGSAVRRATTEGMKHQAAEFLSASES